MRSLLFIPLLLVSCAVAAQASTPQSSGTLLNVSATAEASKVPDIAQISVGVVTQNTNSTEAMRTNAQEMQKVMRALREANIAERDIQTTGASLNPQYRYQDNQAPSITGYQASNTVSVKIRDIARLGDVLSVLTAQGSNQINGPTFSIDQPEPVYDQARMEALKNAQARAQVYASALGLRVVRIVSIDETGGNNFRPMAPMMASARADSTPIAVGETTISVTLNVVFELR